MTNSIWYTNTTFSFCWWNFPGSYGHSIRRAALALQIAVGDYHPMHILHYCVSADGNGAGDVDTKEMRQCVAVGLLNDLSTNTDRYCTVNGPFVSVFSTGSRFDPHKVTYLLFDRINNSSWAKISRNKQSGVFDPRSAQVPWILMIEYWLMLV